MNLVKNSSFHFPILRFFSTLSQSFQSRNDVYKLLTKTPPPGIDELYAGVKYLSGPERIHVIKDSKFDEYLDEIESRISSMNSAFLGNYSLRLSLLAPQNPKVIKVVDSICDALNERPEAHPREIVQCGFAAASVELDKPQFFDYVKQQLTSNIDLASADTLNLSLHMIFKLKRPDRVFTALVCEKLAELTDRFTAHDVVNTLRTLSRTALCKGFLLRRLSTLISDNLDQFDKTQLIHSLYRLSTLKFVTEKFYSNIYTMIEKDIPSLSDPLKLQLLITASLCNLKDHKIKEVLKDITPIQSWDTSTMFDYCYSLIYFKGIGKDISSKVKSCLKLMSTRHPITSRRYALTFKEALDELASANSGVYESLSTEWIQVLDKFVEVEKNKIELQPGFQEVRHILETASKHFNYTFKPLEVIDNFQVNFLEESKRIVIDVESPTVLSNFAIKHRYLNSKGYNTLCVRYWEWRRLKTECEELSICFRRYDKQGTGLIDYKSLINLLYNIGIHLSYSEKQVLRREYEERGGFTLGDLLTLGETFYNNQTMKDQIEKSLSLISNGKTIETKLLFDTLLKLEHELLGKFLFDYCQASDNIDIDTFVSSIKGMIFLLFIGCALSVRMNRPAFIVNGIQKNFSNFSGFSHSERPIIALLNFKCYLKDGDFSGIINRLDELVLSSNVKLLVSPPNIHIDKFRSSLNGEKYEICSQSVSTLRGFGAYTGEVTAEMLKDIGVNWCLVGHPESDLARDGRDKDEFGENTKRIINAMENDITPILILSNSGASGASGPSGTSGTGGTNRNDDEIDLLINKLDRYFTLLRKEYPAGDLHLNVAYESRESIGSGIPISIQRIECIVNALKQWVTNKSHHNMKINILYGGSLNAKIAKDYLRVGCDGLLFGKCSVTSDLQYLIDHIR